MAETAIVVQKAYDWNLWILPKVEKFPKSYRFSVGQSLVATSLDLLMNLVDATYQSKNSGTLAAAVKNVNRAAVPRSSLGTKATGRNEASADRAKKRAILVVYLSPLSLRRKGARPAARPVSVFTGTDARLAAYCAKASAGASMGCLCLHSALGHCSTGPAFSHFSTIYGPPHSGHFSCTGLPHVTKLQSGQRLQP